MSSVPTERLGDVVAVVGATGRQGSAVVDHLLRDGWVVRALSRNFSGPAARSLEARGAQLHQVDAEDVGSLRKAFDGVYGIFSVQNPMTSGLDGEVRQGRNVAAAAADSGVRHVVYGAAGIGRVKTGVGSWDSKITVSDEFRRLGVPLTVLRPMAFMELMTDPRYYPKVSVWHVMPKLMGPARPVGWLCTDDLGAVAARVFAAPERWVDRELSLVADVQPIEQCRALWAEINGRAPRSVPMPVWMFERFVGTDLTTMWRWLRTGQFEMSTATLREILPEALTVRAWLERRRHGPPAGA